MQRRNLIKTGILAGLATIISLNERAKTVWDFEKNSYYLVYFPIDEKAHFYMYFHTQINSYEDLQEGIKSMIENVTIFMGNDCNEKGYFSIIVRDKVTETENNKIGLILNETGIVKSRLNKMSLKEFQQLS